MEGFKGKVSSELEILLGWYMTRFMIKVTIHPTFYQNRFAIFKQTTITT